MAFREWLKRYLPINPLENPATSLSDPANWLWPALGAQPASSGVSTSPETALETMPVLSAVKLLSGAIASLPLLTYRETDAGKERAPQHPAYPLLKSKANPELSSFNWREVLTAHVLLYGNAYAEVERTNSGAPLALWPIYPAFVTVTRLEGRKAYVVRLAGTGETVVLRAENMLHVQGFGLDGNQGLLTTYLAREALGLAKATEKFGASFFGNGAAPFGFLKVPGVLDKATKDKIKASWEAAQKGLSNAQRIAVLDGAMDFTALGIPPEHAQFLQTREFSVLEIARLWNIPPHMLASLDRATFASLEQQSQEFVTFCLLPLCKRIEAELKLKLFDGSDYFAEFQLNGLLRGDSQARAAFYTAMLDRGVYSINEVRALENMNPIGPEGDARMRPLNMTPLGAPDGGTTNDQ